ncbi:MAG: HD domain-containing protein, partial [Kiritimatiellae bacterium]|nr:HD domain-containing protein [Kiritimatiellia bacterium]
MCIRDSFSYEVATFRKDHSYSDGRHPAGVTFADVRTDAQRRDFTINAMFYDPLTRTLYDYVGGGKDIKSRLVRCVGHAAERIAEDHLRMLRAVRFAATLDFEIEEETARTIRAGANLITKIAPERIRDELERLLLEAVRPGDALGLLDRLGLLEELLPDVARMKGQVQPVEFHPEGDVFTHTVAMLNMMTNRSVELAFSVLLHDIAKPVKAARVEGELCFHGHAEEGARMAERILSALRFPSQQIAIIATVVRNHMRFQDVKRMKRSTLRRIVGAPTFPLELELHRLDCLASHGHLDNYEFVVNFARSLAEEPVLPRPWVNGYDIMALGVPEGPGVSHWRRVAYDAQLEGRFSTREELLAWLGEQIKQNK